MPRVRWRVILLLCMNIARLLCHKARVPCHNTRARAFTFLPKIVWRVTFMGLLSPLMSVSLFC